MLYFAPWKKLAILGVCLFGIILAMPNLFYERADEAARANAVIEAQRYGGPGQPTLEELQDQTAGWPSPLPPGVVNLGLDLRGGAHLLVEVSIEEVVTARMQDLRAEVRQALREGGVRRYTGLTAQADHVRVRVTNPEDVELAGNLLRGMASPVGSAGGGFLAPPGAVTTDLMISEGDDQSFRISLSELALAELTNRTMAQTLEIVRRRIDEAGTREPNIQRQGERRVLIQVPGVGSAEELLDLLGKTAKLTFHDVKGFGADAENPGPGEIVLPDTETGELYLLDERAILSGENLVDAQLGFHHENNLPVVNFRFDTTGARIFAEYTARNVGRLFAVVLDGEVITAPRIQSAILGGSGFIEGNFTAESATNLSILLRSGALPASLDVIEQRTVGPDLGADSIAAGKAATILAFLLVLFYMAISYGRFGLFANVALVVNVALIFGVLSLIGATLTLPGIAGLVLTIGMAVDANVLIFERIREELRNSKGVSKAIERGYEQAFSAIIDANITTLIAAVILFAMGSGPVKGFAVTLGIGIVTSVFTATLLTRLIVTQWLSWARPKTLKIEMFRLVPQKTSIRFLGLRRLAAVASGCLVAGSVVLAIVAGLNFGIDFRGGTLLMTRTVEPVEVSAYRDVLDELQLGDVAVTEISSTAQAIGAEDVHNDILIRIEQQGENPELENAQIVETKAALEVAFPDITFLATEAVGAKVSAELLQAGVLAVALAVLAVLMYIWLRFEWQFGVGAVVALVHDVALTIGVFSILQIEFNLAIIAAVLTIVGYSLNDTVVVYDRVRENLRKYKKMSLGDLLDLSVNETLSRTVMTSVTTLVALVSMFLLGPSVILGFTFAMIWGIVIGTYSSIFIAAPLLMWLGVKRDWSSGDEAKPGVQFGGAQV